MSVVKRGAGVILGLAIGGGVYFVRDRPNKCLISTYNEMVDIESTWVDAVNADERIDAADLKPTQEASERLSAIDIELCTDEYKTLWKAHIQSVNAIHDKLEAMSKASDADFPAADEALGKAMEARLDAMKKINAYLEGRSGIELEK